MKNLFKIIILLACVTVQAQPTNGVKISNITGASTPLTGAEIVPMNQSGVTKTATVAQIIAGATAANLATSNTLAAFFDVATNKVAQTNAALLAEMGLTNTVLLNAITGSNNAVRTAMTASNIVALAAIAGTNAAIMTALGSTNTLLTNQIYNLQTNLAAVAASQSGAIQSGGSATFSAVTATRLIQPVTVLADDTTTIDFSQGSFQVVNIHNSSPVVGSATLFSIINYTNGDNVFLLVKNASGAASYVGPSTSTTVDNFSGSVQMKGSVKEAMLNWQCFGTNNIVFSGAYHP